MRFTAEVKSSTAASVTPRPRGWAHGTTLVLLLAACAAVRFLSLDRKPYWFDEAFSVEVARLSWPNFLHLLWWREANMSVYYLLLRLWLHFGQSTYFIRSLSVATATLTLPLLYWLARLLFDRRVALIAAALFTFNGYSVRYSQEARSYSLFLLLATAASGLLVGWLAEPTRRSLRGYVTTSVLGVYSHFYALLLVMAHGLTLRFTRPPQSATESSSSQLHRAWWAIAVLVLPMLAFVAKTGAGPIRWIQRPSFRSLIEFFENLCGSNRWPLAVLYVVACAVAISPVGARVLKRDPSRDVWRLQFLLIWFLFPILLTVVLSWARPVFLPRYMIFCLPPLLILAAAGLEHLHRPWMLGTALAVMLYFSAQGVFFVYGHDYDQERDASLAASNFILDHSEAGDAILFHIAETRIPYEFALSLRSGTDRVTPAYSAGVGPEIIFPKHGAQLDYRDFTGKPSAELVQQRASIHRRVWVMLMHNGTAENPDPTTVMLTKTLAEFFPRLQRWQFAKVELRLYSQ